MRTFTDPDDRAACTAVVRGRCSVTPTMPLLTRIGTTPFGAGNVHVTLLAPLSSSIPLTVKPLRSSTVFHVPPWILKYHVWSGLSSTAP